MSQAILILGESGQGKSSSMKDLDPASTLIVNVLGKELPFLGSRAKYNEAARNMLVPKMRTEVEARAAAAKLSSFMRSVVSDTMPHIKMLVVDDFQYLISTEYMIRAKEKSFDKFVDIGQNAFSVFDAARSLRDDLKVVVMSHTEEVGKGSESRMEMKTIGKMFRQYVTPEGYFSVVLVTDPEKDLDSGSVSQYRFRTQTNGADPVKSPQGMFPLYIPNDLRLVSERIDEYYEAGLSIEDSKVLGNTAPIPESE